MIRFNLCEKEPIDTAIGCINRNTILAVKESGISIQLFYDKRNRWPHGIFQIFYKCSARYLQAGFFSIIHRTFTGTLLSVPLLPYCQFTNLSFYPAFIHCS